MGIALSPPIAGGRHIHQSRVLPVLHVPHEDPVLDQSGAVRGRAFIIDRDRAAAIGQGAVIDNRDAGRGDPLAYQPCECRGFLAVKIAFEPVTNGFVQQDARPARAQHDIHHAGRRGLCFEVHQGNAQRFADHGLPRGARDQAVQFDSAAAPGATGFAPPVLFDNHRDVEPRNRSGIGHAPSIGAQNFNFLAAGRQGGRHLNDPAVQIPGKGIDFAQSLDLNRKRRADDRIKIAIELAICGRGRACERAAACANRPPCGVSGAHHRGFGDFRGMGIAAGFAAHGPQPESLSGIIRGILEPPIIKHHGFRAPPLQKKLAIISAQRRGLQD